MSSELSPEGASLDPLPTGPRGMVEAGQRGTRLPLGEDLVVGHVHARSAADTEASSLSPRIKRRIRTKTSLAEIERKERGRPQIPGPPRLRTLLADAAEVPISEGSLVPVSTPTSGPPRAHPYTPVGNAMGSSSFEMVPSARARAASDRGYDESTETIPIVRASSSPSIIQVPTHCKTLEKTANMRPIKRKMRHMRTISARKNGKNKSGRATLSGVALGDMDKSKKWGS